MFNAEWTFSFSFSWSDLFIENFILEKYNRLFTHLDVYDERRILASRLF